MANNTMAVFVVDGQDKAEELYDALYQIDIDDDDVKFVGAAYAHKRSNGRVRLNQMRDIGGTAGALSGGGIGLVAGALVAGPLFPVGAAIGGLVGAAATGLYTRLRDTGVNDQFIKDVAKQLDKGKSALFVMYEGTISPAMVDALRVYDAELVYGELPEGAVEAVTEAYEAEAHEELVEELDIFNEAATEEDLEATEEDVEAMTALAAVTADVPEDNLEVIDGIGPKVSAALKAGGITTYKQLHEAGEPALRAALTGGGVVPPASMTTWSKQAEFAVNGDWKGLFQYNAKRKVKK